MLLNNNITLSKQKLLINTWYKCNGKHINNNKKFKAIGVILNFCYCLSVLHVHYVNHTGKVLLYSSNILLYKITYTCMWIILHCTWDHYTLTLHFCIRGCNLITKNTILLEYNSIKNEKYDSIIIIQYIY